MYRCTKEGGIQAARRERGDTNAAPFHAAGSRIRRIERVRRGSGLRGIRLGAALTRLERRLKAQPNYKSRCTRTCDTVRRAGPLMIMISAPLISNQSSLNDTFID